MSDHSKLGASGSHRWINCPGCVGMIELAPDDKSSTYADGGTAAHEILKRCLEKGVDADLFLDTVIQVEDMGEPVEVDEEMVEAIQVVLDYVAKRLAEGWELLGVEVRFDLSPLNPPGPMYGRADIVLRRPAVAATKTHDNAGHPHITLPKPMKLEVIDLKYGVGVIVEVERNSQLMYYALGAVLATNEIPGEITSTVVQPRAIHVDGIVRSWTFDYSALKEFKTALFHAAERTQDEGAPLVVGSWCRFCPAQAICPEQLRTAEETARTEFGALVPIEDGESTIYDQLPVPGALEAEHLTEIMEKAPVIEAWFKAIRTYVRDRTEEGEDLGYKLIPKRGRRLFVDMAQAEENMINDLGDAAWADRKLKSVTQAEKAYKAAGIKFPIDAWHMVSSGTNLVPNDDPRPAVPALPKPEEEFSVEGECEKGLAPVGMTPEEVVGLRTQTVQDAEHLAAQEEFEEVDVDADRRDPVEQLKTWQVETPDGNLFYVTGDTVTEAKEEARRYLEVDRLPNHTEIVPL